MSDPFLSAKHGVEAIAQAFQRREIEGGKVLVPYIMAGDPDLGTTIKIVRALSSADVDLIELGMPFSDPLADGPVIQRAGERALRQGVTLKKLLATIEEIRLDIATPIVIMTYYNLFYHYGLDQFAQDAARAGVDGVIVPDLPVEEAADFQRALDSEGLALIFLIAPTSTDDRIEAISRHARGFLYYVSRTGVTGEQSNLADDLSSNLARIRSMVDLPVVVGFGISTPDQALMVARYSDGVVMGSALVRLIEETDQMHDRIVAKFVNPIIKALHSRI